MGPLRQPALRQGLVRVGHESDALTLGVQGLLCRIRFWVESPRKHQPIRFIVDCGASYCYINKEEATNAGIPIPTAETEVVRTTTTATGPVSMRYRVGRMRGWWNEARDGHPMDWPVFIRMDDPPGSPPLLGLGGVIRVCRWTLDGTPEPDSPFGTLTMEGLR